MELKNKKVFVIGVGRSGLACVRYLVAQGACVTVNDRRPAHECQKVFAALDGLPVHYELGSHDPRLIENMDLVVTSPGIPQHLPLLARARARKLPIMSELELAVREIHTPIVAVTGTNGKTTTTALIGHLLQTAGKKVCIAGNIGMPLLDVLEQAEQSDWVVLEVSSFQLETVPSLAPHVAVWLNASPDHLDRHASFEEYVALKARLFHQLVPTGTGIYNVEDAAVVQHIDAVTARCLPFSVHHPQTVGGWSEGDRLVTVLNEHERKAFSLAHTQLYGPHNQENMLAALLAVQCCGVTDVAVLTAALASFHGLRHRLEFVRELAGVRYYDDSKGTNIGATIGALKCFSKNVVLVAGGQAKGVSFEALLPHVKDKVKQAVLLGEAASNLAHVLQTVTKTDYASSMEEAVRKAQSVSEPGDVVLLSPACASFDMFRDYAERGEAFVSAVKALAMEEARNMKQEIE